MAAKRVWKKGQFEFNEVRYHDLDSDPRPLITAHGTGDIIEGLDDVEFWDIEALKLAVLNPGLYSSYTKHKPDSVRNGGEGLFELGFLWEWPSERKQDNQRATMFGWRLIAACQRVHDAN